MSASLLARVQPVGDLRRYRVEWFTRGIGSRRRRDAAVAREADAHRQRHAAEEIEPHRPRRGFGAAAAERVADLADALERSNLSAGSNYVRRAGESFLVRADARLRSVADIGSAVIATRAGVPVRVKDVGQVVIGGAVRTGSGSVGGSEAVLSTILKIGRASCRERVGQCE